MNRESKLIPNSFQVPNFLVDALLPHLSGPQAKILWLLCRKTFGWNKREDTISIGQYRHEAGVSRSAACSALNDLVAAGLVVKAKRGTLEMSTWSLDIAADPEKVLHHLAPEIVRTEDYAAQKTSTPYGLVRTEVQKWSAQRTINSPHRGPTETHKPKTQLSYPAGKWDSALLVAWEYFCDSFQKESSYKLTDSRRRLGVDGLTQAAKYAEDTGSGDPDADALPLLKLATDRMKEDDFHNGRSKSGKKFLQWEQLFTSTTYRKRKLVDYWLDDDKFPAMRGDA